MKTLKNYFRLCACSFIFYSFGTWKFSARVAFLIYKSFVWMKLVSPQEMFDLTEKEYETGKKHFERWKEKEL